MFTSIALVVLGAVAGATAALKVIAPKTKTTKDDKVLEVLEKVPTTTLLEMLTKRGVVLSASPTPRQVVVDHRTK